eukprot:5119971-Pyramimonas_sp.AAC.1
MDIPDVTNIREWQMHAARAIAGSSPEIQAAPRWITEAMDPAVDEEQLKKQVASTSWHHDRHAFD